MKVTTQEYSNKKREGTYAKLKNPKIEYNMVREDGVYLTIPKTVYDHFKNSGEKKELVKKGNVAGEGEVRTWKDGKK